jgi:hypothetical protein
MSTVLARFLHCMLSPYWLMRHMIASTCARYSLVLQWEKMDMLKTVPLGSLILRFSDDSLMVTRSVGGIHGMGGRLFSCPFSHSKSFSPLGLLRMVVILVCCQSVVPSTSLLKDDLGGTHRNCVACVVALKN